MANPVQVVPSLGHAPAWLQGVGSPGYDAVDLRRPTTGFERGEGVSTFGSFRVVQRGAGANMSVDLLMDDGVWVRGDSVTLQGLYYVPPHSGTINVDITAAHATLPRLDIVVLEVKDNAHDSGGLNQARVSTISGTATSGATLDNRTGAPALPASAMHLADVLVGAADTVITDAEIGDRRPFQWGAIPPLTTDVQIVPLTPYPAWPLQANADTEIGDMRCAMLVHLPQRIVGASRIRWRYSQGPTAAAGLYSLGIYDASGRRIVDTTALSLTGPANTVQIRSETITATTFDAGSFYLFFGLDLTNTGTIVFSGYEPVISASHVPFPNVVYGEFTSAGGGANAPNRLTTSMTDLGTVSTHSVISIPQVAVSVG